MKDFDIATRETCIRDVYTHDLMPPALVIIIRLAELLTNGRRAVCPCQPVSPPPLSFIDERRHQTRKWKSPRWAGPDCPPHPFLIRSRERKCREEINKWSDTHSICRLSLSVERDLSLADAQASYGRHPHPLMLRKSRKSNQENSTLRRPTVRVTII